MPVNLVAPVAADLHPIAGVRIGVAEAGVRKAHRKDLTVFLLDEGASVAGVFTQNRYCAAPVQLCRAHLAAGQPIRALVVNPGIANAGTGEDGLARARAVCKELAGLLGCTAEQILPFSTGVIMEPLPVERINELIPPYPGDKPLVTADYAAMYRALKVDGKLGAHDPAAALDWNIDDIAAALGYSEAAAFIRAYKRWFGRPPGQDRR